MGSVLGTAGSGQLLHYFEWPVTFYVFSVVGGLWYLLWLALCSSSPDDHPFISEAERALLATNRKQVGPHAKKINACCNQISVATTQ